MLANLAFQVTLMPSTCGAAAGLYFSASSSLGLWSGA